MDKIIDLYLSKYDAREIIILLAKYFEHNKGRSSILGKEGLDYFGNDDWMCGERLLMECIKRTLMKYDSRFVTFNSNKYTYYDPNYRDDNASSLEEKILCIALGYDIDVITFCTADKVNEHGYLIRE